MTKGDEVKVRVRLDTGQAKADLEDLMREARLTSGRVGLNGDDRGGGGGGTSIMRTLGLGAAFGVGLEAIRSPTAQGVSTMLGEAFGGWGRQLENWALGDSAPQARAAMAARESTIGAFQYYIGATGQIPDQARRFFAANEKMELDKEHGRFLVEQDNTLRGPQIGEIIDKIATRLSALLTDAVDRLADKIIPSWMR